MMREMSGKGKMRKGGKKSGNLCSLEHFFSWHSLFNVLVTLHFGIIH